MEDLKFTIMRKFGWTEEEAIEEIEQAKNILIGYLDQGDMESAFNVCEECFGLEPDFIMELTDI